MLKNSARFVGALKHYKSGNVIGRLQSESARPSTSEKHRTSSLDKKYIVWAGKYKTTDEVPDLVSLETMQKAKNKARIKIANYLMLATIVGCIAMVFYGKKEAKEGKSVQQYNLDWHKEINESDKKKN